MFGAGAVAGVVGSTVFVKNSSRFVKGSCVFAFCSKTEEVEATNEDVRFQPFHNIEDAFMRATADYDAFTVFFNNKVLFVKEVVGEELAVNKFVQTNMK